MAFNDNYLAKSSNIALLLEKKQLLTRLSKVSSEFLDSKDFWLNHSCKYSLAHAFVDLASVKLHLSRTIYCMFLTQMVTIFFFWCHFNCKMKAYLKRESILFLVYCIDFIFSQEISLGKFLLRYT